ncbi:DUF5397 family protein [Sansalvadorimonas verongulae]|uniref:DUF5397 family protein n=1 Tax=Sansalvadorimonas verongulae TaxID=2172824 RepID=UPI0012BCE02F|nr:DUF5397 family protein [Sansalvadorimonas verongulae]MTI13735.1 hypothetical protein [Sansalvadorimonas verongulae]
MPHEHFPAPQLIGQYRRFGELGPAYKIVAPVRPVDQDDWLVLIQIPESGEETEYRYSNIKNDPVAH